MTTSEPQQWIVVPNWDRFQHYEKRHPIWIKVYTDLLHDPNWLRLTPSARAVLLGIWLLYASGRRALPLSTAYCSRALQMRVTSEQLKSLNDAGYIEFSASKPLAIRARSREVEKEKNVKTRSSYEEPLEAWSYPQVDETDETFDFDKIKYSPKEMP